MLAAWSWVTMWAAWSSQLFSVERALDTVYSIAHGMHGAASPLHCLGSDRPLDRTAGMGRTAHTARDKEP